MPYRLLGPDGPYESEVKGTFGGNNASSRKARVYGRMDCTAARWALDRGGYVARRVFFEDEATAIACGFRPCARCLPDRYAEWKRGGEPGTAEYPWLVAP
ncbi:MAG: metal-binding protein [Acidimicrobiia bacterium]|nr:metal-binding protein [Acidimicrobiia bacterium]